MKKHGMKKRVLAALMTACMVVGAVPGVSLADVASGDTTADLADLLTPRTAKYNFDGTPSEEENADIELDKKAKYNAETDDYTITLSAKAKKKVETKKTHVVFLLDASGSMNFCTETNPNKDEGHFHYVSRIGEPYNSGCTKIDNDPAVKSRWEIATKAIKTMTDNLGSDNIDYDYTWFNDENTQGEGNDTEDPYSDVTPEEGTYLKEGVNFALTQFYTDQQDTDQQDTDQVLIIVADGETSNTIKELNCTKEPWEHRKARYDSIRNEWIWEHNDGCYKDVTYYPEKELGAFKSANGKVYTVGFTFSSDGFKNLANDPDNDNFNATNENSLNVALNQISQKIRTGIIDPLGDSVELVNADKIKIDGSDVQPVYNAAKNEITWTDSDGLNENGITLTYTVRVKDGVTDDKVYLNGDAKFRYSVDGEEHEVAFPRPYIIKSKKNEYSVVYGADDGKWDATYEPESGYELSSDRSQLTRTKMTADDMIEVLAGENVPKKQGYTFKGWQLVMGTDSVTLFQPMRVGQVASKVEGQEHAYRAYVKAIWEKDGSVEENDITYSVNQHYIAPDHTDNTSIEGLTAEKDTLVKNAISGYTKDLPWRGDTYLYHRTTVTINGENVDYDPDTAKFTKDTTIDIYYYRDSWDDKNNSETGGDGIPDIEQVLVKFGSKDRGDWVTGSGIVQVYTLDKGQTAVTPVKKNITVNCDKGYHFTKWTKNDSVNGIEPFTEQTGLKGGETINFWAWFEADEPTVPAKPVAAELPYVTVICTNSNASHSVLERNYWIFDEDIIKGRVIVDDVKYDLTYGQYVSHVKVIGAYYAGLFDDSEGGNHIATDANNVYFDMVWNGEKWTAPDSIKTIKISCAGSENPKGPTEDELKALIEVALVHTGSNAHPNENYPLIADSYDVETNGSTAVVTVKADKYVEEYNSQYGKHAVQGKNTAKLVLDHTDDGWKLVNDNAEVSFTVKCSEQKPESPKGPTNDDLKKLFGKAITVICTTDADHAEETFGLIDGSFHFSKDKDADDEGIVTVTADKYIKAFNDGKHTNAGDDAARVKLYYDAEEAKWCAAQDINITFKAKCEKKAPEKQYTEIKFIVVNGTFTENGKNEITKTFEVGTKLTVADIPASKGKSSSYSDQTWDKFPVGYVVGEDGETFTITYKWRSTGGSGSDSDDSDYDYTSTRGKATNAAGKSGRWILEGGEFTEDNGRLPSNEYLKIGDTIYGFYTYGFAIDFDRPEYYTDEAIQAKGGYRDATGTWRLNGWWFCYDDGTFPHNEWVYLSWNGRSDWYYFDVDGWMEDGWFFWNNNWYYLHTQYDNTRGHMYTGWHEIDGKWYYFNTASDKGTLGAMLADTTTPDGYRVDANGAWIQ